MSMTRPIRVLSLGAGVQSSTVLLMSCIGVLPKLDHAIFADTQWEPPQVYEALEWLEAKGEEHGIPVHRVTAGSLREHTMVGQVRGSKASGQRYASIPLRVRNPDGSDGMIRRQCTREYKIQPIDRYVRRELLNLKPRQRAPSNSVEKWFGISRDEISRVRHSTNHWEKYIYPLVGIPDDLLPHPMTRSGCFTWLQRHFPDFKVGKSSCIGCPFRDNAGWREIKANQETWADAVEVDAAVRKTGGKRGECFLHRQLVPLPEADLNEDQMSLLDSFDGECMGYCGI